MKRLLAVVVCALTAAFAADEPGPNYIPLKVTGDTMILWDAASVRRSGEEFEVAVLTLATYAFTSRDGAEEVEFGGSLGRQFISCDWALQRYGGRILSIGEGGRTEADSTPAEQTYRPINQRSDQAKLRDTICGQLIDPNRSGGFRSIASVVERAQKSLRPSGDGIPPVMARFASLSARLTFDVPPRFGLAFGAQSTGNVAFVDWASRTREGDTAQALTLWVVRTGLKPGADSYALRKIEFDCAAKTISVRWEKRWQDDAEAGLVRENDPGPIRPVAGLPASTAVLDKVCAGKEPAKAMDLAGALTFKPAR